MKTMGEYEDKYKDIPEEQEERLKELTNRISDRIIATIPEAIKKIKSIKWKEISYVLYIIPKATPRPRYSGITRRFYVKGALDTKKMFQKMVEEDDLPYINHATIFHCKCYFPIPSGMSKAETLLAELGFIRPIKKPDWDNVGKTYSDMIQGILLEDDAYIIDGRIEKFYSTKPRLEMNIKYQEESDSKFNERKITSHINYK